MPAPKHDPRRSIYIRDHLERLLASSRVPGKSDSQRIDRLAARYDILAREALPKRLELTANELVLLAEIVRGIDLTDPDMACMLPVKLQQRAGEHRDTAVDPSSLAYRLRNLRLSELLAVIDLCERVLSEDGTVTRERAADLLSRP